MLYWVNQFSVAPDQPGGTRHVEMAGELIRQSVPTTLVASDLNLNRRRYLRRTDGKDRRWIKETVEDVPFVWLPAGSYEKNDWRRAMSMVVFTVHVFLFLLQVRRRRSTVFIGSTPHLPAAAATWIAARIRRVPFVLEVRDLWPESMVGVSGESGGLMVKTLRILSDQLYRRADHIVVLAYPNIERLVERGAARDRITYVPNGVDVDGFEAADLNSSPVAFDPDHPTFSYTGAHGPANGLDVVLAGARILQDRGSAARILLVGDGSEKASLQAQARQLDLRNVTFADPIPKSSIPAVLSHSRGALMILANVEVFHYGVSPNKLFDYLTMQVPVITNVPGEVARIVTESEGGVIVPPDDPVALADAISQACSGQVERTGAKSWIRTKHDRRQLASTLVAVLEQVRDR